MAKTGRRDNKKRSVMDINTVLENTQAEKITKQQLITNLRKSDFKIEFKNKTQEVLWNTIQNKEITFCSGPAGTGKSYLSVAKAIELVLKDKNQYKKIIIIKPVVESEEKMGFLPGDVNDKISPYIYSTLYLFEKILGKNKTDALLKNGIIQPMALAYMRGMNIDNAVVLLEEGQNTNNKTMRTVLTRLGENCKMIISGDLQQSDIDLKNGDRNGLQFAMDKLRDLDEIGIVTFDESEIVRNQLIGKILKRFNGDIH
jgi:phosphate starvation-inducible PhoH-like protein